MSDELRKAWESTLRSAARGLERAWTAADVDPLKPLGSAYDLQLAIAEVCTAIRALDELDRVGAEAEDPR